MSDDCTQAGAPFDHAKADIILRSSNNVDFRVFKLFLSLASPVFETLFSIPQPTEENRGQGVEDGLPVISVTEDSKILNTFLCFCYPCTLVEDPDITELNDALDILEVVNKYSVNDNIEKKVRRAIINPDLLKVDPLRCFAIAHQGRLREETLLTAKHTLTQPLIPSWFQEIELITSTGLLSLLTYHERCGNAVYELQSNLSWIKSHYKTREAYAWLIGQTFDHFGSPQHQCKCLRPPVPKYELYSVSLQWWEDFMEETFSALRDRPCKETVVPIAEKTVRIVKARGCQFCSPKVANGMHDFVDLLSQKIEEIVDKVELEVKF